VPLIPNPFLLQAYERYRSLLVEDESYILFWPATGKAGSRDYAFMTILNPEEYSIKDGSKMLREVLGCSKNLSLRLAWSFSLRPDSKGGIASFDMDDTVHLCVECSKWSISNRVLFSFGLTTIFAK